jgi:hypothetical protein
MNRTQIGIIASWAILTGVAVCVATKVTDYAPYGLLLFLFVRERFVDESLFIKEYFSDRHRITILLMVFSIAPFVWYLYRLFSAPNLPDTFRVEVILASIPLLIVMAIYDRWLYIRTARSTDEYAVSES